MKIILQNLELHLKSHPKAELRDAVKFLFQASFGGGHMIADPEITYQYLLAEAAAQKYPIAAPLFEPLGLYTRLSLSALEIITPQTMNGMFIASAKQPPYDGEFFRNLTDGFCASDAFPFPDKRAYIDKYIQDGCPAVHHSAAYREAYAPAYRVIRSELAAFFDIFTAIDRLTQDGRSLTVAIDGCCAAGKTTLAAMLSAVYGCNVFHADHFFLPPELRTPERFATPGGNMHWERLKAEVLDRLESHVPFSYRVFDCSKMEYNGMQSVLPRQINVVEGSYVMHPALRDAYGLTIFLKTDPETQRARILARNGEAMLPRFQTEWIPLENRYFEACSVEDASNLTFTT